MLSSTKVVLLLKGGKMKNKYLWVTMVLLLVCLMVSGCKKSDQAAYEEAKQENTIDSYQNFIKNYPGSQFEEKAKQNIDLLRYSIVTKINTIQAYEDFIQDYPGSRFHSEALNYVAKHYFELAKEKNTISAYIGFLEKYPKTSSAGEAVTLLNQMLANKRIIMVTGTITQKDGSPLKGKSVFAYPLDTKGRAISLFSFTINGFKLLNSVTKCDSAGRFTIEIPFVSGIQVEKIKSIALGLKKPAKPRGMQTLIAIDYGKERGIMVSVKKGGKELSLLQKNGIVYKVTYDKRNRFIEAGSFEIQ